MRGPFLPDQIAEVTKDVEMVGDEEGTFAPVLTMFFLLVLGGTHYYARLEYDEAIMKKESELVSKGRELKARQYEVDSLRSRR
jgi:hypothetical protein